MDIKEFCLEETWSVFDRVLY